MGRFYVMRNYNKSTTRGGAG